MCIVWTFEEPVLFLQCYSPSLRFHSYNYYPLNLHSLILEIFIEGLFCASHLSSDFQSTGKSPKCEETSTLFKVYMGSVGPKREGGHLSWIEGRGRNGLGSLQRESDPEQGLKGSGYKSTCPAHSLYSSRTERIDLS